jgi:arylsulfatase A-like enzyme
MRKPLPILVASLIALAGCAPSGSDRPFDSVFLITIDTLRADHVGAYGYPRPTTPFLDQLASQGVLFENAYSSSSHTAPSHASIFTSLYPESHGVQTNGTAMLPDRYTTLAESFARLGYETAAFTSTRFLREISHGFQHVDIPPAGRAGLYRRARGTLSQTLEWLEDRDADIPVFVWVHLYDVHERGARGPHRKFLPGLRSSVDRAELEMFLENSLGLDSLGRNRRRQIDAYDAQLAYADSEIKGFYRAFGELRPDAPALWVVTADHGEGLGNHNYMGHGRYLYREQLRVPLIFHASPAHWQPSRVPAMVRLVDLYPTLLGLVRSSTEDTIQTMEGISLVPLLRYPDRVPPIDYLFAQRHRFQDVREHWESGPVIAAQNLHEKYIHYGSRPDEYYDLRSDPLELNNLAGQNLPEAERLRTWLMERYLELQQEAPDEQEILPQHAEELKALGYIN